MSDTFIKVNHLSKQYSKRKVVSDVSLKVKKGEVIGLLGPNGAGKTTTFYMITGMIKPFSGKISLDSLDITGMPMYKRALNKNGDLVTGFAGPDHPVHPMLSENGYLKSLFFSL